MTDVCIAVWTTVLCLTIVVCAVVLPIRWAIIIKLLERKR